VDSLWKKGDYGKLTPDEKSALDDDLRANVNKKYGIAAPLGGWTRKLFAQADPRLPIPVIPVAAAGADGRRSSLRAHLRHTAADADTCGDNMAVDQPSNAVEQMRRRALPAGLLLLADSVDVPHRKAARLDEQPVFSSTGMGAPVG